MVVMGDEVNAILPRWKWPVENYARLAKRQATNSNFCEFPEQRFVNIWSGSGQT